MYDTHDQYSSQQVIAYVHLRNVRGKVPEWHEVFMDEGAVDMIRALRTRKEMQRTTA